MKTEAAFFRSRALMVAGALLITVFADGCITHPPNTTKENPPPTAATTTTKHRRKHITHPPNKHPDHSKDGPVRGGAPTPAPITHPGN